MTAARRRHAVGRFPRGAVGLVRAAAVVTALLLAGMAGGCSDGSSGGREGARRGSGDGARRNVGRPAEDTASLLTPIRGDSLIGAARGVGGVATLRTECVACHPVVHDAPLPREREGLAAACVACHATSHEPIQAFYAGAVSGTEVPADTMFVARVGCAGCHTDATFATPPGAARLAALDAMCTSCHGERFTGMLAGWRDGIAWRTRVVTAYVGQAAADPRLRGDPARVRVQVAREALALLREAGAIHNVIGADQLFRVAADSAVAAYARAGVTAPARPALGPDPSKNACLTCHYGVETARTVVFEQTFDHATHVVRTDIACTECHSKATYFAVSRSGPTDVDRAVDPEHGRTRVTAASCDNCHHAPDQRLACTTCHRDDQRLGRPIPVTMALRLKPANAPTSRAVAFAHSQHRGTSCASCHNVPGAVQRVASCSSCHTDHHREQAASCASCHGTRAQAAHTRNDHLRCASCHTRETLAMLTPNRTFCTSCHVTMADHEPGRECSTCHLQASPAELKGRIVGRGD